MAFFEAIKNAAQAILQSKTVTAGTSATAVTPDSGYDGLSSVTVNPTPSQAKTGTPTTRSATAVTVTPDSGKLLSSVTVNTNSVPNTNSGTYTFASGDTGGTKDLGVTNTYRYVNAANVYAKGKADAAKIIYTLAHIRFESTGNNYRQYVITNVNGKVEVTNNAANVSYNDNNLTFSADAAAVNVRLTLKKAAYLYTSTERTYYAANTTINPSINTWYMIEF